MIPYLLSWYDGKTSKSYYINNYKNPAKEWDRIIKEMFNDIFTRKYRNYKVYFHIFSKFDSIFLLKYFSNISNCFAKTSNPWGKVNSINSKL